MNDPVFLHIGLHKTGTTYLQEEIFPRMPDVTFITRTSTQLNHAFNRLQYADDSLFDPEDVLREMRGIHRPDRPILISDESLSGKVLYFNYINRTMIARRLGQIFPDATVILFIRGQIDIILSHYNQYVRSRGMKSIDDFLWLNQGDTPIEINYAKRRKKVDQSRLYYNTDDIFLHPDNFLYYPLISTYKSIFNRVEVLLQEDLAMERKATLAKLYEIVGRSPHHASTAKQSSVNESLASWVLPSVRLANRLDALFGSTIIGRAAIRGARWIRRGESGKALRTRIAARIDSYYDADNARVIATFPEIGIQRYPTAYPITRESRSG